MKLVVMSDTHGYHKNLKVPDGDVFVHCGDFSMRANFSDVNNFANWVNKLPHKHKLVIPGNHDVYCEDNMDLCKELFHPTIFEDAGFHIIEGNVFLCYSWTPAPHEGSRWKFHPSFGDNEFFNKFWTNAPYCDVLVTHGPPKGILDMVEDTYPDEDPNVGESHMLEYINRMNPKYHFFGHIHEAYGNLIYNNTFCYNASTCNLQYKPTNPILEVEI